MEMNPLPSQKDSGNKAADGEQQEQQNAQQPPKTEIVEIKPEQPE